MRSCSKTCGAWVVGLGLVAAVVAAEEGRVPVERSPEVRAESGCEFFGPPHEWGDVEIVLHQASPLAGAREYHLGGEGWVSIVDVVLDPEAGPRESRWTLSGEQARVQRLIDALCAAGIPTARAAQPEHPPTCVEPPTLAVRNAAGEVRRLAFPREGPSPAWEQAWLQLDAYKGLLRQAAPVHEGPYDETFVPPRITWWAGDILVPLKRVEWARVADPDAQRLAEVEFQRKLDQARRARVASEAPR